MERLNNILGKSASRRPLSGHQQPGGPSTGGARAPQSSLSPLSSSSASAPFPVRRQLPEQMARLGQRYPDTSSPSSPTSRSSASQGAPRSPRSTRDLNRSVDRGERTDNFERDGNANNSYGPEYNVEGYATASYPDPSHYDDGTPRSVSSRRSSMYADRNGRASESPAQTNDASTTRSFSPQRKSGNGEPTYYGPDRYAGKPRADVLSSRPESFNDYGDAHGDFEEDEEEEDGASIYYDDWEAGDDVEQQPVYRQSERLEPVSYVLNNDVEAIPSARPRSARESAPPPPYLAGGIGSGRATRDLRSLAPVPVTTPGSVNTYTRDVPLSRRVTQPLNPHAVSELRREREVARLPMPRRPAEGRVVPASVPGEQMSPSNTGTLPRRSVCPRCRGAGYLRENVPYGHPHFGKAVACECKEAERKEKRRQQLREISNLDAFHDQSFVTFDPRISGVQEAYQAAREFADNPDGWLLLYGPNGCGKTHLAIAIAQQALDSGAVVLFETVPDLLDHLRAAFAPTATEVYDQLFSKMREAEVLILDDLGAQQSSPWANEKLFQLLNYRYNMGLPTVITANSRILSSVDERIRSRLGDISLVIPVNMDRARDYRPRHAKQSH
jgi:DNA replication protein DnaC